MNDYDKQTYEDDLEMQVRSFTRLYKVLSAFLILFLIVFLLWTVNWLPAFGDPNAPENNEVAQRYIEKGMQETGAVNIVTGMILDYRAFDTFGESCVLFIASCCVLALLRVDKSDKKDAQEAEEQERKDKYYEPKDDSVLQRACDYLLPLLFIFGIYIILNGHISPGGGFAGGAVIGSGLILHLTAYGYARTHRFMNEKVVKVLTMTSLIFYCAAKSYSFYTGANHLESIITPGISGNILSGGLIPYLNICVGIVVACTMYSFFTLFRRGGI